MSNMREISVEECNAVFGGEDEQQEPEIVVTAPHKYYESVMIWDSGSGINYGGYGGDYDWGYGGGGGGADDSPLEYDEQRDGPSGLAVDENGDGEFDVIVVNPASSSGYFFGVGLSVSVFGGTLHYDINGERWYLTPETGFGTPVQVQIGYSEDVANYLGGPSVTALSGNPGVPVVSYNGQNVSLNTHVIGTPSVGAGYGVQLPTLGEVMLRIEQDASTFQAGLYDWIENGSPNAQLISQ